MIRSIVHAALLVAIAACAQSAAPVEHPFVALPFDAALSQAKQANKPVMVDFFTTWCGPCKRLDRETWKDPAVVEWLDRSCIALKADAEKETALAKRFDITGYPTIVFVAADGKEIDRLVGFRDAQEFLRDSQSLLAKKERYDKLPKQR